MAKFEDEEEGQGKGSAFLKFLYNSNTHQVLGRTASSWGLILIFYLIFYSLLSCFWGGMLAIFVKYVLKENQPQLTGQQSLLDLKPGLGFKPIIDIQKTLIHFNVSNATSYGPLVANLTWFSNEKLEDVKNVKYDNCYPLNDTKESSDKDFKTSVCPVNPQAFYSEKLNCTLANNYGYSDGKPCIFVKMNKIYGWMPKNTTTSLVTCEGQTKADAENLGGNDIAYYPEFAGGKSGKFSHIYFPFLNQNGYRTPVVAVQFLNPRNYVLIMIKCTLLLDTVDTSSNQVVKLELMVDK